MSKAGYYDIDMSQLQNKNIIRYIRSDSPTARWYPRPPSQRVLWDMRTMRKQDELRSHKLPSSN